MIKIIHISGTPGTGKTTLGEQIKKRYKNRVAVVDTDSFISHGTSEAKQLLKLENKPNEYRKLWSQIIKDKIDHYIDKYLNKIIIFTGLLNNWAIDDETYKIHVPCIKYYLDVPLAEIMRRYYLRIYLTEQKVTKKQSEWYWSCLVAGKCYVHSSTQIVENYKNDLKWHKKNKYKVLPPDRIMIAIDRLLREN